MWWDVYVPKVVVDEHLKQVACDWQQIVDEKKAEIAALRIVEARLHALENSTGWRYVLWWQAWFARRVHPESRLGHLSARLAQIWIEQGVSTVVWASIRRCVKFALKRLRIPSNSVKSVVSTPETCPQLESSVDAEARCEPPGECQLALVVEPKAPAAGILNHLTATTTPTINLYTSSVGNYFFDEIKDLIAGGMRQLDVQVNLRTDQDGFDGNDSDWHIVLAPHEFFQLGDGPALARESLPRNLVLINTEQPSTHWFRLATDFFPYARWVWDIDYLSAQRLAHRGLPCHYLPLGYVPQLESFMKQRDLPENYGTCFLEPQVRFRSRMDEPLAVRPIDLAFFGNITTRRESFFSMAAASFAKHRTYFYFSDGTRPLLQGQTTHMNTATVVGLVQRTKILLNVHRDADRYFESHRIVMHGIWQKALVISEPCSPAPPFRPGIDYVEAPLEEIPEKVDFFLNHPIGRRDAQDIADQGFRTLSRDCQLADVLKPLLAELTQRPAAPQERVKIAA